jgi:two-component system chemotaxis response regulator CheY
MVLECNFLEERMKLLVVDDSNIMRRAISKYLGNTSLELVGTAGDGMEALKLFQETLPDLVTMDITMPKMDGLDSLKKILEIKEDTKILVVSALSDKATGLKALTLGAKGFLSKPFTQEELVEEIRRVAGDNL